MLRQRLVLNVYPKHADVVRSGGAKGKEGNKSVDFLGWDIYETILCGKT